ncbi:MAG: heavy metal translocating P-type ATPase metal-binding domain-containing protein [Reichenbachiella sp.]
MDTIPASTQIACYHCGDDVQIDGISIDEKSFCCHGCKTVFELLDKNDLCDYYSLEDNPGNQLSHFFSEKYNYLDTEEIADLLLDFKSEKFHKVTFRIPTIHCSSCIWLLENLTRFDEGIINSQINFSKKRLSVNFEPKVTNLKNIVDLLCKLGYEPEISLNQNKEDTRNHSSINLIKLGIAGFVFGNIMLLSFPEYLGIDPESIFTDYFAYINLALSLPILFYCASEFYLSAFGALSKKVLNIDLPITIGIAALFLRSTFEILTESGPGYLDSLAGLVFFLLIGRWFQSKTYEGLSFDRNFKSYFPLAVTRVSDTQRESVLVEKLVVNDVIFVRNEEILPCDSILMSNEAQVDYSFVTGESLPVKVLKDEILYAGGRIKGQAIQASVTKAVSKSYLTQLWNNPALEKTKEQDGEKLIDRISQYFTPLVLGIALLAGIYWTYVDSSQIVFVLSSVLIIACPCALALATPFTLGSVLNLLGGHQFYLKNTAIIEKLWKVDHLIFDKTGTITSKSNNVVIFQGNPLSDRENQWLSSLTQNSTHPLSQHIHDHLIDYTTVETSIKFKEQSGAGLIGTINGHEVKIGSASFIGVTNQEEKNGSVAFVSIDGEIKGYFSVQNHYRKGLKEMINGLKNNYNFTLLSGDNDSELQNLTRIFPQNANFHFKQSPEQKLNHVKSIQENDTVVMIGDGLNDAGALGASDVGISVAENISSFTPASEAIILGKQLVNLSDFFRLIRQSKKIIIIGFTLSFLYNIVGISFAVAGYITPIFAAILMPLSSITVVAFSTLSIQFLGRKIRTNRL